MQGNKPEFPASKKATDDLLNKIGPSDERGRALLLFLAEGICDTMLKAHALGRILGLSEQRLLDVSKAALAAYLAGMEAAPRLDEMETKR